MKISQGLNFFDSGMNWVSTIYYYQIVMIVNWYGHVFADFWSFEKDSSEFSLIAMNIQTNLSGSSLEHDLPPSQTNIEFFSIFRAGKHLSCLTHWSPALKAPSPPSFTKLPATRQGKLKDTRNTAAAASFTAATSDRGGTREAVGLSLLWLPFP